LKFIQDAGTPNEKYFLIVNFFLLICSPLKTILKMLKLGIRHEDKYDIETRTPLIPADVFNLMQEEEVEIIVEPSDKRVYSDDSFIKAGAKTGPLDACQIIIGVKEVPVPKIEYGKIYLIFSHVIKGQKDNMPALKKMMEKRSPLSTMRK